MPDWTQSMQQTFEYYIVDPLSWKDVKKIDTVKSASISRDEGTETLGSASFELDELYGESYIRTYLITIQNGVTEKFPLGTFLVQTPSTKFNGRVKTTSVDAYTPLIELKDNKPPLGYSILKDNNILEYAYIVARDNLRCPVVKPDNNQKLYEDFVADTEGTWSEFVHDLVASANYHIEMDELGRVAFAPDQNIDSMTPVWTFDDGNSSILKPDITINHDIYGIPNVVEVVYSKGSYFFYSRIENDNPNSPISTVTRGREIVHRVFNPSFGGLPTQNMVDEYARQTLKNKSSVLYSVTYTHAYCPVRLGDCVRLNYRSAELIDIKAKVISQNISCVPGTPVSETAVFKTNLWGG